MPLGANARAVPAAVSFSLRSWQRRLVGRRTAEDADYLASEKTGNGAASRTSAALTSRGCAALDVYTKTLRALLTGLYTPDGQLKRIAVPGVGKLRLKTRRFQPVTDCPHAIGSRRRSQYLRVPRPTRTLSRITGPSP